MKKNKKSQNNSNEKLRNILDSNYSNDLHSEDEKYLRSLSKRMNKTSKDYNVYKKIVTKDESEKEIDTLKPRVTIHSRTVVKILEFLKDVFVVKIFQDIFGSLEG